jgi:hypothetical protein
MPQGCIVFQVSSAVGVRLQTSFMFLTLVLIPLLITTIAFLPRHKVRWPPLRSSAREPLYPPITSIIMQRTASEERPNMATQRSRGTFRDHVTSRHFLCHVAWLGGSSGQMAFFDEVLEGTEPSLWNQITDSE